MMQYNTISCNEVQKVRMWPFYSSICLTIFYSLDKEVIARNALFDWQNVSLVNPFFPTRKSPWLSIYPPLVHLESPKISGTLDFHILIVFASQIKDILCILY